MASTYFDNCDPSRPIGLKVEEKTFWVSNQGLASYSPVFKAMFFGDFTEAQNQIVPLPDKKAEDILEMLLCLFPTAPEMKEVDSENVDVLLTLADEYQIEFLKRKCQKFLMEKILTIQGKHNDLWFVLGVASKHYFYDVMEECAKKCAVYTLNEAMSFMVGLPPVTVAFVAVYAWKALTTEVHVRGAESQNCRACSSCGDNLRYKCTSCGRLYCIRCNTSGCSVNLKSLASLVEKMKEQDG